MGIPDHNNTHYVTQCSTMPRHYHQSPLTDDNSSLIALCLHPRVRQQQRPLSMFIRLFFFSTLGWVRQSVPSRKFGVKIFLFSPAAGTAAPRGGGGSAGGDTACCMQCCSSGHCSLQTFPPPRAAVLCCYVATHHIKWLDLDCVCPCALNPS